MYLKLCDNVFYNGNGSFWTDIMRSGTMQKRIPENVD